MVKLDATLVYITQLKSCDLITSIIPQKKKEQVHFETLHYVYEIEMRGIFFLLSLSCNNFVLIHSSLCMTL